MKEEKAEKKKNWFQQHVDSLVTISIILGGVLWLTSQFSGISYQITTLRSDFDRRFTAIEKDICVIKTVLIMKNIMPTDVAKTTENPQEE